MSRRAVKQLRCEAEFCKQNSVKQLAALTVKRFPAENIVVAIRRIAKKLPLTRELDFAKQKTEGEIG